MLLTIKFRRKSCYFVFLTLLTFGIIAPIWAAELDNSLSNPTELCAVQPRGFAAWYKGEADVSESTFTNSNSESFFNGTYSAGKVGQAFNFNGINNYAALNTGDNFVGKITLAAWINPTSINGSQILISRFNATIANVSSFQFSMIDGRLYFQVNQNDSTSRSYITSNIVITAGVYQHVAASFNSSMQLMEIFVDGASVPLTLVNSGTVTSFLPFPFRGQTKITLGVLTEDSVSNKQYFGGQIDEVLMFRRVLSTAEVQSIYNAGSLGVCNTFNVSGQITTASGRHLDNVFISTADNSKIAYSLNDPLFSSGYTLQLDEDHTHTITPIFSTHSFSPSSYIFNPIISDQSEKDFTATLINDNFDKAVQLSGGFGDIDGNNQDASREAGEPLHAGTVGGTSVWYRWRAPRNGTFTFSTEGSRFNTLLAVYQGTSVANLMQVAANDNIATATSSKVTFTTQADTDYYIAVDGRAGAASSGYFKMLYYPADIIPGFVISGLVTTDNSPVSVIEAEDSNGNIISLSAVNNEGKYSIIIPQGINSFKLNVSRRPELDPEIFTNIIQNQTTNFLVRKSESSPVVVVVPIQNFAGLTNPSALSVTVSGTNISGLLECTVSSGGASYSCPGLLPFGTYTITPSHPVHTFTPTVIVPVRAAPVLASTK